MASMNRVLACLSLLCVLGGCTGQSKADAPEDALPQLPPALAAEVDALAGSKRIESEHIGPMGTPSEGYKRFTRAWGLASDAERVRLTRHESPVVRGYFGARLAREGMHLDRVEEMLRRDEEPVEYMKGCFHLEWPVRDVVAQALCMGKYDGHEPAKALVERVYGEPSFEPVRHVMSCR